jgi:hypothetical protein
MLASGMCRFNLIKVDGKIGSPALMVISAGEPNK